MEIIKHYSIFAEREQKYGMDERSQEKQSYIANTFQTFIIKQANMQHFAVIVPYDFPT